MPSPPLGRRISWRTCPTLGCVVFLGLLLSAHAKDYCQPGQPCWPTSADLQELESELSPESTRSLWWYGPNTPRVCSVPVGSPAEQPLYDAGKSLRSLYVQEKSDQAGTCFVNGFYTEYCLVTVRNGPYEGWTPAFTVWPLNAKHVSAAVKFAVKHNLCIAVAGPGHDFLNRHSCDNGVFIRTSLMKDVAFDFQDSRNADGSVTFGPGIVFSEAQNLTSGVGRYIASGWGITVGIVGWSLGGGHGPFAQRSGLGVDNILEAEIVTADGSVITVNSTSHPDLYWAIRGGGGSTWGVVTSLTLKMHKTPPGGVSTLEAFINGTFCGDDAALLNSTIDFYLSMSPKLNTDLWSGLAWFTPENKVVDGCSGVWSFYFDYVYAGSTSDAEFMSVINQFINLRMWTSAHNYANWWDRVNVYPLETIDPTAVYSPVSGHYPGGVPSVLVPRDAVLSGQMGSILKARMMDCHTQQLCERQQIYHDIYYPAGASNNVSISAGFRTSIYHYVVGGWPDDIMEEYYALGSNSYMNEAAYMMGGDSWKQRLWGANYDGLLAVKKHYDPENVFWCRHCVGSDL